MLQILKLYSCSKDMHNDALALLFQSPLVYLVPPLAKRVEKFKTIVS